MNFEEPALQKLIESLPDAPAAARRQCLEMCGLGGAGGGFSYDYTYDKDSEDSEDRQDSGDEN